MRIDPDGNKDIVFDADGTYTGVENDNFWHNLWHGNRGVWKSADGDVTFRFQDEKEDISNLEVGVSKLIPVSDGQIMNLANSAGAFNDQNRENNIEYLKEEGKGNGQCDFSFTQIPNEFNIPAPSLVDGKFKSPYIFLVMSPSNATGKRYAMNHMNFGNFMFGVAGATLVTDPTVLLLGAHYNSLFPTGDRYSKNNSNGYPAQFDSLDDQVSISMGSSFARSRKWHKRKYVL